jgi:type I restriction enzyme R subunit
MDKKSLSEQDICSKYVLPAIIKGGYNLHSQIREQVTFTAGRIQVHGKTISRGEKKRADFILYYKNNLPVAVIEAKDNNHTSGAGLEQAKQYAEALGVSFAYSTNGDEFVEFDFTTGRETTISIDEFPSSEELLRR